MTNYTTHLQSPAHNVLFMKNAKNNRTFAAYAKLKRDVTAKEVPDVNTQFLKYYQTNFNFKDLYADKIFNIDLKSAYASILFNENIISKDSFDYLAGLPKVERLSSVGMLAGRKNVFSYEAGRIVDCQEIISPYSNFFFHAVKRTYEIMDVCKMILGNSFVFSWVDGIYFTDESKAAEVMQMLLNDYNLLSTFAVLEEFELKSLEGKWKLTYKKEGQEKFFYIPFPQFGQRQSLYNYLITKNNE